MKSLIKMFLVLLVLSLITAVACSPATQPAATPPPLPTPSPTPEPRFPGEWTQHETNPVLDRGSGWEAHAVLAPSVIKSDDVFRMWYSGYDSDFMGGIGYAWSPDGVNWTRHSGNPIMEGRPGEWDSEGVVGPVVLEDGDTLRMWYCGTSTPQGCEIGYATSEDGITWVRHPAPVLQRGQFREWNAQLLSPGTVIKEDGLFMMWFSAGVGNIFTGQNIKTGIGYATSSDGIQWTIYDNPETMENPYQFSDPVLNYGGPGEWDSNETWTPSVRSTETGYEMWYAGWRSGGGQHIGYATSPDGVQWTRDENNPVLRASVWAGQILNPRVIVDGGQYHMWFHGWTSRDINGAIGYATAPIMTDPDSQ